MESTPRKLKSLVLFQTIDIEQITSLLEAESIPLHTGFVGVVPVRAPKAMSFDWCSYLRLLHGCEAGTWRKRRAETKGGSSFGMGPFLPARRLFWPVGGM